MRRTTQALTCFAALLLLAGCGTLTDIKNANQLIRADNELAQLLSARTSDGAETLTGAVDGSVEAQLVLAGDAALKQAQLLRQNAGVNRRVEAVAWYRIAATAHWQSGAPQAVDKMFKAAQDGQALCAELGDKAPDRDSVYLKLVIPFAAFEASANTPAQGLLLDLGAVEFGDDVDTTGEIGVLKHAFSRLNTMKAVLQGIDMLQSDAAFTKHPSLRSYYNDNRAAAHDFFENARAKLWSRLTQLEQKFPPAYAALDFTVADVADLKF